MSTENGNTIVRADTQPVFKRKPVILTPTAQKEVNRLLQGEDKAGLGLRLGN